MIDYRANLVERTSTLNQSVIGKLIRKKNIEGLIKLYRFEDQ